MLRTPFLIRPGYVATLCSVVRPLASVWVVLVASLAAVSAARAQRFVLEEPGMCGAVPATFVVSLPFDAPTYCAPLGPAPALGRPLRAEDARRALEDARRLAAEGKPELALISLALVSRFAPEVEDRLALLRGAWLIEAGRPREACAAYDVALASPEPTVAAHARVGAVRCLLRAGDRRGMGALRELLDRYDEVPWATALRYDLAQAHELWRDARGAAELYRAIDLEEPGSQSAARARVALERLAAARVRVAPWTPEERVERAERLVRSGPMDAAREELDALRATRLGGALRRRVASVSARVARYEGRFDDAEALEREANVVALDAAEAALDDDGPDPEAHVPSRSERRQDEARARARAELFAHGRGRGAARWTTTQLVEGLPLAVRASDEAASAEILDALAARGTAEQRFDAAMEALGTAPDAVVARVLDGLVSDPTHGAAASYHRARLAERAGERDAAVRLFRAAIAADQTELRWYALWARQRVAVLGGAPAGASDVYAERLREPALVAQNTPRATDVASDGGIGPLLRYVEEAREVPEVDGGDGDRDADLDDVRPAELEADPLPRVEALLGPVARAHGEAYPWVRRALVLARIGDLDGASDELAAAYAAYRDARGGAPLRAGLESLYRGQPPRPAAIDAATRRRRVALDPRARLALADAAGLLGDHGTAAHFGGPSRIAARPRAHEPVVEAVARRHGLDPNLLLAVMRVESVFDRRIVSYAGAVGLMQIMPRTGRLIADELGLSDFTQADLLDPRTNLEMAAWYLASLIRRFDGRVPLAIAAYNGGPHNVRRWMRDHPENMPLDAFLERIPFGQTHRYVRRVLGHYAAYRAQRGLAMVELPLALPAAQLDPVAF